MRFLDQIGDCQLQLVGPQPSRLAGGCQAVSRTEEHEDVGGLPNEQFAGTKVGRRKRRAGDYLAIEKAYQLRNPTAVRLAANIDICGAHFLQSQTYKLPPTLDRRPIVELITHVGFLLEGEGWSSVV